MGVVDLSKIEDITEKDKVYKKVFLGFVDTLGYSNLIKSKGLESPKECIDLLLQAKEEMEFHNYSSANDFEERFSMTFFSDTLILVSKNDDPYEFWKLLAFLNIYKLVMLENGLLTRGSVVYGNHFDRDDIWVSPALVEAAEIEKNIAEVARIVVDPKAYEYAKKDLFEDDGEMKIVHSVNGVKYKAKVWSDLVETDYDNNLIIGFNSDHASLNYIKNKRTPGKYSITKDMASGFVKTGNELLQQYMDGIAKAKMAAKIPKHHKKIDYLILKWNQYIDSFQYPEMLKANYKVAIG